MEKFGTFADKDTEEYLDRLGEKASIIRGAIITRAIDIERLIDQDITTYFFPEEGDVDSRVLLSSIVLRSLSFRRKSEILEKLLKLKRKQLLEKYPKLFKDIKEIVELRNDLAHTQLDRSLEYIGKRNIDQIQFSLYKEGKRKVLTFTDDDVSEYEHKCLVINGKLVGILRELGKYNFLLKKGGS